MKKRTFLIICGFECQQKCVFCSTAHLRRHRKKTTKEIFSTIKSGRRSGYCNIEFSGGEVTIRNDVFKLIAFAKACGYKEIGVVSNGMMFSDIEFCKAMTNNGLSYVLISIHGHTKRVQEKISGVPGSFKKTIEGIKNLKKLKIPTAASTAINRFNFSKLDKIGTMLADLGVLHWMISDLIPDGAAKDNYRSLAVSYSDLHRAFKRLKFKRFKRVQFWYFPFCVFPEYFYDDHKIAIIDSKARKLKVKQSGYHPKNVFKKDGRWHDVKRVLPEKICGGCRYVDVCGGVFKEYLGIFPFFGPDKKNDK